jgi:Peptidase A4 family
MRLRATLVLLGLIVALAIPLSATAATKLSVSSKASPTSVSAKGGTVALRVHVSGTVGKTECIFSSSPPLSGFSGVMYCQDGTTTRAAHLGKNTGNARTFRLKVTVVNSRASVATQSSLRQAKSTTAIPTPAKSTSTTTTSTTTTTTTLGPTGPFADTIWAGYVVPRSTQVTSVSGSWTVPHLDCAVESGGSFDSWDGIGGVGYTQLLQTGVAAYCEGGVQTTYAWWELIQPIDTVVPFDDFPVSPGDTVTASVYQADGAWVTRLDDLTTGMSGWMITDQGYGVGTDTSGGSFVSQGSEDLSFAGGYTAEWIVEDSGYDGLQAVLANFGTITFSDLETSFSPFTLTPGEGEEVVQNGATLMTPSPPTSTGFSVSYTG